MKKICVPGFVPCLPSAAAHAVRRFGVALILSTLLSGSAFAQAKMTLQIRELVPGKTIAKLPKRYTLEGKAASPPLIWTEMPKDTKEFVLLFENLDTARVHWLMYSIPAKATSLPEGIQNDEVLSEPSKLTGTIQGITDFKKSGVGYIAPSVNAGKQERYQFTLYALDAKLGLQPGLDKASLMFMIQGHIIGKGELIVTSGK